MSKKKTQYICSACGYTQVKWAGKCPNCNTWDSFEEQDARKTSSASSSVGSISKPVPLPDIEISDGIRINTYISELNQVLGGGFVEGSLTLIGGDPGIGKSTIVMQLVGEIAGNTEKKILYVSGEESTAQIKLRAERLKVNSENIIIYSETNIENVISEIKSCKPDMVIIDSIQAVYNMDVSSIPGSLNQIREVTSQLMHYAKFSNTTVLIIGHVTKTGVLAGPKVLEHLVDTVLYFEGDRNYQYRILRAIKNRFGSTNEVGIFEMGATGLQEIKNPSKLFLSGHEGSVSGTAVASTIEGTRPILVELQALASPTNFGNPQRVVKGIDIKRLNLLLAVLEKRMSIPFGLQDVFINVVSGVNIYEPAVDMAVIAALVSNFYDLNIRDKCVFIGEVGLSGEIRNVSYLSKRVSEAQRLGFEKIIIPKNDDSEINGDNILEFGNIKNFIEWFRGI